MKENFVFRLTKGPLSECLKRASKEISFVREISILQWNNSESEWLADLQAQASRIQISKAKCKISHLKPILDSLEGQTDVLVAHSSLSDLYLEWTGGRLAVTLPDELYCRAGVVGRRSKLGFFQIAIKQHEQKFFDSALGNIEVEYEISRLFPAGTNDSLSIVHRKVEVSSESIPDSATDSNTLLDWIGLLAKGYESSVQEFAAKGSFYSTFNPMHSCNESALQIVNVLTLKSLLPAAFVQSVLQRCGELGNFAICAYKPEAKQGIILFYSQQDEIGSLFCYKEDDQ